MVSGAVTNRYTEGLYQAAVSMGNVDQVEQGLKTIASAINSHPDLKAMLVHPLIDGAAKLSVLKAVFGESVIETVYQFLQILFRKDRSGYIVSVADAFHQRAEEARGRVVVHVESAGPLGSTDLDRIKQKLSAVTGKQVEVDSVVNKQLIAGYRVRFGNRVLDATVKSAIEQFSEHLLAAGASKEGTR